jgi:DNA-binding GntR family transcriptional regulator
MDLVKMRSLMFISEVIEPHMAQLQATVWTDDQSNAIENDHRELLTAYRRENSIASIIDQHDHTTTFNEAWDSLGGA